MEQLIGFTYLELESLEYHFTGIFRKKLHYPVNTTDIRYPKGFQILHKLETLAFEYHPQTRTHCDYSFNIILTSVQLL